MWIPACIYTHIYIHTWAFTWIYNITVDGQLLMSWIARLLVPLRSPIDYLFSPERMPPGQGQCRTAGHSCVGQPRSQSFRLCDSQVAYQKLDGIVFNILNQTKMLFTALFVFLIVGSLALRGVWYCAWIEWIHPWKNELNTLNTLNSLNAELSSDRGRQSRVQCLALVILTAVGEPRWRHSENTQCGLDRLDRLVNLFLVVSSAFRLFDVFLDVIYIYPHLSTFICYVHLCLFDLFCFVLFSSLFLALEPRLDSGWNVGQVAQAQAKWRRFQGKIWKEEIIRINKRWRDQ